MTVAQWLNVEESEHFFALEKLESWNVAWRNIVRQNLKCPNQPTFNYLTEDTGSHRWICQSRPWFLRKS